MLAGVAQEVDQRQLAQPVEVVDHHRAALRRARSRGTARAGRGSRPRCARASRGRAGSARDDGPTGRRSSRSRRRRARRAVRRTAGGGAARRSARGGRRGASRPTGRTRCSRRSAGRVARRSGSPGVVAWRMPRHSSSRAARPSPAPARTGSAVTGSDVEPSRRTGRPHRPVVHAPYAIVRPLDADQPRAAPAPSPGAPPAPPRARRLDRRSAHPHRRSPSSSSPWHSSPGAGVVVRRGRVQPLRRRPARPRGRPSTTSTSTSRRSSTTGPARSSSPGSARSAARSSTFDQIPGEMIDATTAIEDKDFWTNPGFDPVGIVSAGLDTVSGRPRGASTITQQLVRARLLPAEAFEGSTYERKVARDHPVDPPDPGVSRARTARRRSSPPT